jgi:hypothetical protein
MTANPKWIEIESNLFPHQTASDRPDIVARVFELKMEEIVDDLSKKCIFGPCANYIFVKEFQGRGLPHIHTVVSLKDGVKFKRPDVIDK